MKLQITIDAESVMKWVSKVCEELGIECVDTDGEEKPAKSAKKSSSPSKKTESDEDTPEASDVEMGNDESPTVETVIEALQKYAEENSRDAAKKILASFKVKSVHDLDEKDFPKILKKLS